MRGSREPDPLQDASRSINAPLSKPSAPDPSKTSTTIPSTTFSLFKGASEDGTDDEEDEAMVATPIPEKPDSDEVEDIIEPHLLDLSALDTIPSGYGGPASDQALSHTNDASAVDAWDNGENVTPEERAFLLALDSDSERTRVMNIRFRDSEALEEGLIDQIPSIIPKSLAPPVKKKAPSKAGKASKAKGKSSEAVKAKGKGVKNTNEVEGGGVVPENQRRRSDRSLITKTLLPSTSGTDNRNEPFHARVTPTTTEAIISAAPSVELDEDALPEWMENLLPHLNAMCEGPLWTSLLVKWVDLERQLGFPKGRVSSHIHHFQRRAYLFRSQRCICFLVQTALHQSVFGSTMAVLGMPFHP